MARKTQRASEIETRDVFWLWSPYIARRKLTLMDGDPGSGKSNIMLDLTARITTGRPFPGHTSGATHKPRPVLYLTQEDDLDDTVVPRLIRAGADLDLVILDDQALSLATESDMIDLAKVVAHYRPSLIVLDTLAGYIGGETDVFRENSVRPVLIQLALLARKYECSVVALRHLVKGEMSKALYLGQGSMAMVGVARSVLLVAQDTDNPDRRALFQVKNNLGRMAEPLGYKFEKDGTLAWTTDTDMTMADVMKTQGAETKLTQTQIGAKALVTLLGQGPVNAKTAAIAMESHGVSPRTVERIRKTLGVVAFQEGGQWWWKLPDTTDLELLKRLEAVA